jgi:hypothetical protein
MLARANTLQILPQISSDCHFRPISNLNLAKGTPPKSTSTIRLCAIYYLLWLALVLVARKRNSQLHFQFLDHHLV